MRACTLFVTILMTVSAHAGEILPDKVLEHYLGTWKSTFVEHRSEWNPEQKKGTSTWTTKRILDGRFLETTGTGPADDSFRIVAVYDTEEKIYREWYFNDKGIFLEYTGQWDPASKTLMWTSERKNGYVTTVAFTIKDQDTSTWRVRVANSEGKIFLKTDGESTRVE